MSSIGTVAVRCASSFGEAVPLHVAVAAGVLLYDEFAQHGQSGTAPEDRRGR